MSKVTKSIPMCWKCRDVIMEEMPDEAVNGIVPSTIVGCKVNTAIKNYNDAEELCSILPAITELHKKRKRRKNAK